MLCVCTVPCSKTEHPAPIVWPSSTCTWHHQLMVNGIVSPRRQTYTAAAYPNSTALQLVATAQGGAAADAGGAALNATQPFLFIGVLTHPNSTERRRAVRETWTAAASHEVDFKFVHYQVCLPQYIA